MSERPTPETDAFFRTFADGEAAPSHAEYYDRMAKLERERNAERYLAERRGRLYDTAVRQLKELQAQVDELKRERDEFRQIAINAERELQRMEQLVAVKRSNNRSLDARNKRLERERDELRADLEFRRGLFKLQEEQLNEVRAELDRVREERSQYRGMLIRLHNDLFVHHGGQAVREFKELFREENYN